MLNIIRVILSIIVLALSGSIIFTQNSGLTPYLMLFLGVLLLVIGIIVLLKDKKSFSGYMNIIISLFVLYVSIQQFTL
ncbi:hypothetical protein CFK37_18400 [Virgibacillus phasianinus]|uniref:DUF3953 domain-containing protein n=1 Tax=Virgibacillus phasianinus TaxID=2017483 RepID=A0A220U7W6_9BACI|nr:hypothetical protein CFK37_18400 [Virgibacillus phasianinus]